MGSKHKEALRTMSIPELIAVLGRIQVAKADLAAQEEDVMAELARRRRQMNGRRGKKRT